MTYRELINDLTLLIEAWGLQREFMPDDLTAVDVIGGCVGDLTDLVAKWVPDE
jgi:hypothetical protein